jgi:hypothetical protein
VANTINTIGQIFYEPATAFASIKEQPRSWVPLLAMIVLTAGVMYWYLATVDFAWLVNRMIESNPGTTAEGRAMMEKTLTKNVMMGTTLGSVAIMTPVMCALTALYFVIASKFIGSDIKFGKWFAFSAWAKLPALLTLPLMALQILSGKGQVAMEQLNMMSLNFLVFQLPQSHKWATFLTSLDLTTIWTTAITVIGLRVWTGRSMSTCVTVGVLPVVLVYGLWAVKLMVF